MSKTLTINGNHIHDIPSFFKEINRVFMKDSEWKLGQSLDALNAMFYGGYGEIKGNEEIQLIWENFTKSKEALGYEVTRNFYLNKLKSPETFNADYVKEKLTELENGKGKTYFEIILEIIADHPNIKLITS